MEPIRLERLSSMDINVDGIVCVSQCWEGRHNSWNYLDVPRPCDGLIYVSRGRACYRMQDASNITAMGGDIVYLPRGSRYYVEFEASGSNSMLVNFTLTHKNERVALGEGIFKVARDKNGVMYESFSELCTMYPKTLDKLTVKASFFELMSRLAQLGTKCGSRSSVYDALFYINNNLDTSLGITELAKLCAMSESTFRREFKKETGMSPKSYVMEQKIKKAKQLLRTNEMMLEEICAALGFYDSAYFSKIFKQSLGETPGRYRARHL